MRTPMAHRKNDPRIAMWELKNEIDSTKEVQKKWTLGAQHGRQTPAQSALKKISTENPHSFALLA
jgi:hypothetical protein